MMKTNRIILAGGSGFLGGVLSKWFVARGHEVIVLTRSPREGRTVATEVGWDGKTLGCWTQLVEGAQAVINLTGRSVNCRYHERNRREIMESRVHATRVVGEAIARSKLPPAVWLNASTATIYKHSLDKNMDEDGVIGATPEAKDAFSVEVAIAWEAEFNNAPAPHTRKVALRSAMVLGTDRNSVLPNLQRLARFGLGGTMASGKQYMSWIHEEDYCRAIQWILDHDQLEGPVNVTAPNPLPNLEFMRIVRKVCRAPVGVPNPLWLLEFGAFLIRTETELVIKSRRAVPAKLLQSGFEFRFPDLEPAVREIHERSRHPNNRPL